MSILDKLFRLTWTQSRLARRLRHRRYFPGLGIDDLAAISGPGELVYGNSASVGPYAVLNIDSGTRLELGDASYVGRYVELAPGREIRLGRAASLQDRCVILGDVTIGAYCTFAYNVYISSGIHIFDWHPALPMKSQDMMAPGSVVRSHPVVVEEDCWLGNNVVVLSGVRIGRGAIVGANAVVTRDVPPYAVVAGVPAKLLRMRLDYAPPLEIRFDQEACLPYFHAGFAMLDSDLKNAQVSGGLLAANGFSVALKGAAGQTLRINMRSEHAGMVTVEHAGQRVQVGDTYEVHEFPVVSDSQLHAFTLVDAGAKVRVATASIV